MPHRDQDFLPCQVVATPPLSVVSTETKQGAWIYRPAWQQQDTLYLPDSVDVQGDPGEIDARYHLAVIQVPRHPCSVRESHCRAVTRRVFPSKPGRYLLGVQWGADLPGSNEHQPSSGVNGSQAENLDSDLCLAVTASTASCPCPCGSNIRKSQLIHEIS